ncbi:MAG: LptF/LptG family permease [Verrucomicrobia bacterium]|nr:LptF/LptG family permease [Verrucomicrobiota bacterium]|tara:strand:- start:592 stop:1947 length:1356 start_codon:yes stop_codon:yes gene_type:complete
MSNVPRWLPPLLLVLFGLAAISIIVPYELVAVKEQFSGFPDSHIFSNKLRPYILVLICLMPGFAGIAYSLGTTFDRYVTRQFIAVFLICLGALFAIWLLIDLSDNLSDFKNSENKTKSLLVFYLYRSPAILLVLLPYTLLLSLIYGLGKLSKSNEIVAMIQSGTGVVRVTAPLIFAGIWSSVLLLGLNYHWAPHAEGMRDELTARANNLPVLQAKNVLYRDPASRRLWMVGAFPENFHKGAPLQNVEITTINPDRTLKTRMTSPSARWDRDSRHWIFANPLFTRFTEGEAPEFEQMEEPLVHTTWKETPSQIIKPGLDVEYLGIPELSTWLISPLADQPTSNRAAYLTHWHYRWALPITCIVTVLLAAPLSIHFARRGAGSGVFLAVVLSVLMLFVSSITLALGEAATIPPLLAAWLPNIVFTLIGFHLFHRRITGRPIYQSVKRLLIPQT